jgi:DtxR family Mn-dependent transcriptional regulator
MTISEENYLKVIYHVSLVAPKGVSTNAIAGMLDTKASSVTDMLKKLADKNLVSYQKYQGVTLTDEGLHKAKMIVRKHRLWEVFLVEKLQFSWDEVHEIAEELEHIQSEPLIDKLDAFLGFPSVDPHGDPIPDANGAIKNVDKKHTGVPEWRK